jgi:hypothetical protein
MPSGKYWWLVRNTETGQVWAGDKKIAAEIHAARLNAAANSPHSTLVDNPACDCCPHTELSDLERDALNRDVWAACPDSGCLWQFCPTCKSLGRHKST